MKIMTEHDLTNLRKTFATQLQFVIETNYDAGVDTLTNEVTRLAYILLDTITDREQQIDALNTELEVERNTPKLYVAK